MKIQNDENLISRISGVLSSILSSKSPSGGSSATEQSAGAASFGALLSGMTGQQRVSFGDWIQEDGTWYRSVTPPYQTRGVSYYADAEGNLYAKSVVPGAEMRSVETPDWFSGMRPGNPPVSVLGVSSQGQSSYSYGGTVTIDGKEYTTVAVNAAPGQAGGGSGFLIDNDGKWYRLSASQGNKPVSIDTPSWWDGVLPNGEMIAFTSAPRQDAYSYGDAVTIDGKEYSTVSVNAAPGQAGGGSGFLIDNDGKWYRLSASQGNKPVSIDTPSWWDGVLPNGEMIAFTSAPRQDAYSYGDAVTIDGKEYTTVSVNAAPGQAGGGSGFLIDNDGKWYRLSASQGNKPVSIDTPSWWDGVLPNGETNTQLSSFSASSASSLGFLRLGPWENINGTMYRTIWQPGVANRGGEYLIDAGFSWYYRTDAQESNPIRIDTPEWFL